MWIPTTEPPLPTTTERPTPPPTTPTDECIYQCTHITSCKDILQKYRQYDCHNEFNWDCFGFDMKYRRCDWHSGCPAGHIRSGFGTSNNQLNRCIPIYQCQYFAHMYKHLNDLHEDVMQLC